MTDDPTSGSGIGFYDGGAAACCHHCDHAVPFNTATWIMWGHLLRHPTAFLRLLWRRYR